MPNQQIILSYPPLSAFFGGSNPLYSRSFAFIRGYLFAQVRRVGMSRRGDSPWDYVQPVAAVLLVLLGAWWYFGVLKQRARGKVLEPARGEQKFTLPANFPR